MRTERLFLGNETSVNMFDHLFFLHSSFVSLSSLSERLRNLVFISRGRNTEIHHHLVLQIKILSYDLRDISLLSTVVTNSDRSCISVIVKESVLFHTRSNMTMFRMLLIIVCLSEVY